MEKQLVKILFQDEHYIAVDKPSGLLVHPYKKETNEKENLMKLVKERTGHYLYPIHRIDRPVSGIVIFGLSSEATSKINSIWHNESTSKKYIALARGEVCEMIIDFPLNNDKKQKQDALTYISPLSLLPKATLLSAKISTGRKHQIRRHLSRRMHQVIGDTAHGKGKINQFYRDTYNLQRIFLHASKLEFVHPYNNQKISIFSPMPTELREVLTKIRNDLDLESLEKSI